MKILKYLFLTLFLLKSIDIYANDNEFFNYDLHYTYIAGSNSNTMVCLHGFGGNYLIAEKLKGSTNVQASLISFNFPDHDIKSQLHDPEKTSFGSINELLPAIYVLKKCIVEQGIESVILYGFSAGGAAAINTLAVLNTNRFDEDLKKIGVTLEDKKRILLAIQNGYVILDTPLKSIDELIAFRGASYELKVAEKRYRLNELRPMDSLKQLENLSLKILVHFQVPDETLSNRDDNLFIELVKKYNINGQTHLIIGRDGGHNALHKSLWDYWMQLQNEELLLN